jgi:hypothetical protein
MNHVTPCSRSLSIVSFVQTSLLVLFFNLLLVLGAQAQQQAPQPPAPASMHQPPAPHQPASPHSGSEAQFPDGSAYANSSLSYHIIDASNSTFGYDVFVDGKLMIHQTSIPAMPGNVGFKTKDDAAKVAEMVMYKIRKGEMPPTVSPEEMKELNVIK